MTISLWPAVMILSAALPASAFAQSNGAPAPARGADGCAAAADPEEVLVCGRREDADRHRLPPEHDGFDPSGTVMSVPLERYKLLDLGATGIGSCSTVGPGGWTGCDARRWHEQRLQWAGERPNGGERGVFVRVGPMSRR